MRKSEMHMLLKKISDTSARKSSEHGVHYYEHDKNGQYRSCPEAFVVDSVYKTLSKVGWRITAEAHQGGIWGLFDKDHELPKEKYKNRYDLALWKKSNKPVAVCEFKWGFSQDGFRKDARNVYETGRVLGLHPILCLLTVKPQKGDLDESINIEQSYLENEFGIWDSERSKVYKTPRYFCGSHYDNEHSYTQASSFCLRVE
jgi:hypothetical protein